MARTLKDIAEELNISVSTVSRVVNGKKYVKPERRKQILELLEESGYVPNQIARSLKSRETNTIGIIIPDISEDFFAAIIQGIDKITSGEGYSIILADSNENLEKEDKLLKLLYQKRIDALVLATVSKDQSAVNTFINNDIPVIFIDNLPNLEISFDSVLIDNAKASQMAIQHLVKYGHRKIATIAGSPTETTGYERLEGYKRALVNNGIDFDENLIKYGNYKEDTGYLRMMELLEDREKHPFTAVYVTSEKMTLGAIKAIRENNLSIPRDVSLVGFDFHDKTGLISPKITTILQPEQDIGSIVGDLIIKRINEKKLSKQEGGNAKKQRIMLEPVLVVHESSASIDSAEL